jgi:hypothetical protein
MNTDKKTKELSVFIGVYLWQDFVFFTASHGRGSVGFVRIGTEPP